MVILKTKQNKTIKHKPTWNHKRQKEGTSRRARDKLFQQITNICWEEGYLWQELNRTLGRQ